jgi:hypothetical protein
LRLLTLFKDAWEIILWLTGAIPKGWAELGRGAMGDRGIPVGRMHFPRKRFVSRPGTPLPICPSRTLTGAERIAKEADEHATG